MARHEEEREDLLAEATALVERGEFHVVGDAEPVVIGFRRDGCASVYFGADPAYHFNTAHQLRRAFVGGLLYKAELGRLARLTRKRTAEEVQLVRHDLDSAEAQTFLAQMAMGLGRLREAFETGNVTIVRQVPPEIDFVARCRVWLTEMPAIQELARSPRAG